MEVRKIKKLLIFSILVLAVLVSAASCDEALYSKKPSIQEEGGSPTFLKGGNGASCTDSDGGINANVTGIVSGYYFGNNSYYNFSDVCMSNVQVREYYCQSNSPTSTLISCGINGICSNGRCIAGGGNTTTCADTDGGINYFLKGTVSYNGTNGTNSSATDYCLSDVNLREYYCAGNNLGSLNYNCGGNSTLICVNGACDNNSTGNSSG